MPSIISPSNVHVRSIHVRRTDKNTEEKYHDLDEYMTQVEQWYQSYARTNKVEKKRLFIATDEPSVIKEAKAKLVYLKRLHCT